MTAQPARSRCSVPAIEIFRARAEARAILYAAGEFTLIEAVDKLQADAARDGLVDKIGIDAVQAILNSAFSGADA
jgi:hypothetical protein